MEEITEKIGFLSTSFGVKLHHAGYVVGRTVQRLLRRYQDRQLRAALIRDGFKIEFYGNDNWRVNMRAMYLPAKIRMSDRALDRLLIDIAASEGVI